MKFSIVLVAAFFTFSLNVLGQDLGFVRVFDRNGTKIAKGTVIAVSDSKLQLKMGGLITDVPVSEIGTIKTKRSVGNNLAIGSAVGASVLGIIGIATGDDGEGWFSYTPAEGALAGIMLGAPLGTAVGGLTALAKNSRLFVISGDGTRMKEFGDYLSSRGK